MRDAADDHLTQRHHGYYGDRGYTYGVYPEYFPLRLSLIATLHGHRGPALQENFRVLDIGCGQGLGLCIQAALHPQGHFCGIDLLPAHISHGRSLAADASLVNVSFLEADLIKLADRSSTQVQPASRGASSLPQPPGSTPAGAPSLANVDLAVCHGVVSWVGQEVEEAVWQLASSCLRSGGLFSLSYNALPGKLHELPFQHLVNVLQRSNSSGSASLTAALACYEHLQGAGARLFEAQPSLASLLAQLPSRDSTYLLHEYHQKYWLPRFADTVICKAEDQGMSYLGGVSLPDRFEALLPEAFRKILAEQSDVAQRQLLRDLLINESFRRDVYVRGLDPLWPRETAQAIADIQIVRLIDDEQLQRSDPAELFRFILSHGTIQGDRRWFGSFLAALGAESRRVGDLLDIPGVGTIPPGELLQNICLLLEKQLLAVVAPTVAADPAMRLNQVLIRKVRNGAPYRSLAAPLIGSALAISDLDFLALDGHLSGHSGQHLIAAVDEALASLGRDLRHQGRRWHGSDRDDFLSRHIAFFERHTLPLMRRVGAIA